MAAFIPGEEGNYMQGLISSRKFLKFDDFEIDKFLQEGGYGKVYSATRKSDGLRVAMKFFGYTRQKPDVEEIRKEVALMIRLDKGMSNIHELCNPAFKYVIDTLIHPASINSSNDGVCLIMIS